MTKERIEELRSLIAADFEWTALESALPEALDEIEHLNDYVIMGHEQMHKEMKAEIEKLRDENDILSQRFNEMNIDLVELDAEIERLKAELAEAHKEIDNITKGLNHD